SRSLLQRCVPCARFCSITRRLPPSTLFPYTTLFRSSAAGPAAIQRTTSVRPQPRRRAPVHTAGRLSWSEEIPPSLPAVWTGARRSEEHTSELQSLTNLVCRLLLEKKKKHHDPSHRHT